MGDRPRLRPRPTAVDLVIETAGALALAATIAFLALSWTRLPATLPTHFDFAGRPNAWGPKASLLFLPSVALALYTGLSVLQRFPWVYNYAVEIEAHNAESQYRLAVRLLRVLKAIIAAAFGWIDCATVRLSLEAAGRGQEAGGGLGPFMVPAFVMVMLVTVVSYIIASLRRA